MGEFIRSPASNLCKPRPQPFKPFFSYQTRKMSENPKTYEEALLIIKDLRNGSRVPVRKLRFAQVNIMKIMLTEVHDIFPVMPREFNMNFE